MIHLADAPPDAVSALRAALASHVKESVGLSAPHPVYIAAAQDVVDGRVLANARLTGWRAIASKDGEPRAAVETDGSVNEGPFVAGTVEAVGVAEQRFGADARDYELRLLRIPAVYAVAIWLHAEDDDLLIPVAPAPASLRANEPAAEAAFTAALTSSVPTSSA